MPPSYLLRRNRHYFFRLHVPLDLRSWFDGKRELRKSLRTTRYNAAKSCLRGHLYRTEQLFTLMRSDMLTEDQIRKLVADYLKRTLDECEDARFIPAPSSPASIWGDVHTHEILLEEASEDLFEGRHDKLQHVAESPMNPGRFIWYPA